MPISRGNRFGPKCASNFSRSSSEPGSAVFIANLPQPPASPREPRSSRSRDRPPSCSSPRLGRRKRRGGDPRGTAMDPRQRKRSEALRLEPRASISQAVGARRNPSPRASAVARLRDGVRSTQRRAEPDGYSRASTSRPAPAASARAAAR